jgi:hypothetical protein
VRDEDT